MIRLLMAMVLVAVATTGAAAQEDPAVTVDLGIDAVLVGGQSNMSVVISKASGSPELGGLQFDVAFPSGLLTFKEVSKGRGAQLSDAQVKTEVIKPSDAPGQMILRVDVSASKGIPEGPLVTMIFEVAKNVPGESQVKLKGVKTVARSVDGGTLTARALDGTLTVLQENSTAFACFFYMH